MSDEDVRKSMDALRRIVRALRLAASDIESELGITVAQLFVLQQLGDGEPRSINEIADATVTDPSTVSGLVRRLLDAGLVDRKRSRADARRAEVRLTAKGAGVLARAPKAPQSQLVAALSGLPRKRLRTLAAGLTELASRLGTFDASFFFEDEG
jgi:DNA-binding MarR family transcriptional regulator